MSRRNTYRGLERTLVALSPETQTVWYSLPEIERLIGRALPGSAFDVSFWTARVNTGIGRALRTSGFLAELVVTEHSLGVLFRRRAAVAPPPVAIDRQEPVAADLSSSSLPLRRAAAS